jgi:predicted DNA-binding transcriptional regulator YafY
MLGQKSRSEAVAHVLLALLRHRSVKQAELAREIGTSPRVVRQCITDLQLANMPIEREDDHPHVYYSVPKGWLPHGAVLPVEDVEAILRVLARVPSEQARRDSIAACLGTERTWFKATLALQDSLLPRELETLEDLEDSVYARTTAKITYHSPERGNMETRHISVQRIAYHERPLRLLAVCHRTKNLKWFRLDRVQGVDLDRQEPFLAAETHAIDDVVANTLLGFHHSGEPVDCVFVVDAPVHRWFVPLLGSRSTTTPCGQAVRVTVRTAAVEVLARELVGLGAAVHVETPELGAAVRALAEGVLLRMGIV